MPAESAPRVSIITPVYNAERYIERCIDSVLRQTHDDWEQIIVDDGSTDRTEAIIGKYSDPRITYLRLPHRGLAALAESYNAALQASRGELIAILEGDDAWPADKLEIQVPSFDAPDVVLSWGRGLEIGPDDEPLRYWPIPHAFRRDLTMPELFRVLTRWNVLSPSLTVMVRRSALETIGGFKQSGSSLFVDVPTWIAVAAHVRGRARYMHSDLGLYRVHTTNTGLLHNAKMRKEHQDVAMAMLESLGPDRLRELGWNAAEQQAMRSNAQLADGIAELQRAQFGAARAAFGAALRSGRTTRDLALALLGYSSALLHVDLVHRVQQIRKKVRGLSVRRLRGTGSRVS